jgi:hypothetical protein
MTGRSRVGKKSAEPAEDTSKRMPGSFVRAIITGLRSAGDRRACLTIARGRDRVSSRIRGAARHIRRSRRHAQSYHARLIRTSVLNADNAYQEGMGWNPGSYLSTPSSTWRSPTG